MDTSVRMNIGIVEHRYLDIANHQVALSVVTFDIWSTIQYLRVTKLPYQSGGTLIVAFDW